MATPWLYWVDQGTTGTTYPVPGVCDGWVAVTGTSAPTMVEVGLWPAWTVATATNITVQQFATTVWVDWNGQPSTSDISPAVPALTSEQKRDVMIHRTRSHARAVRQRVADRRAEALLLEHLDEGQREEWGAGRAFHVETADGCRRYRLALGMAGNVRLVACEGEPPVRRAGNGAEVREGARFCMHVYHPEGRIPDADNVLAQKLLIESEGGEERFLAVANASYW